MTSPAHIAIVDDDDSARRALARLLRANGWGTASYVGGIEFLAALRSQKPCCLLLDICMPVLNGLEVQAALNRTGLSLPVVFITAHDDPALEMQARDAGAVAFLHKPIDEVILIQTLAPFRSSASAAESATPPVRTE